MCWHGSPWWWGVASLSKYQGVGTTWKGNCWELNSDAQMTTQATRETSRLHQEPPPALSHSRSAHPLRGCRDSDLPKYHLPIPLDGAAFPKYQHQNSFILNETAANPRILPEGLLPPDPWVQSLGTEWDLFWKFPTPPEVWTCTFDCFCRLLSPANPKPKAR